MMKTHRIELNLPMKFGSVNCYLLERDSEFILIDTGSTNQQKELEKRLEELGCRTGQLKLIILTHGDFDHIGNAAYLRQKYNAKIAMHSDDIAMAEDGDMFSNRKKPLFLVQKIIPMFFGFGRNERFKPDIIIENESDVPHLGFSPKIISIPGHSMGSIGILMENGDFFCGDLLENTEVPRLNSIMDDINSAKESVEILKNHEIKMIYPGHGKPFNLEQLQI
ncbi:MAG: MBL fold metallo-hydrolase [Anaerolineaceae bacterium]|nr:MBL fold metallo-hydrolase [Anaerolineaceae bacterium]